jgi:hypothetical protein
MKNQFDPNIDYSATGDCSHAAPFIRLRNDCAVKVSKKLAKQILMNDITVFRLGTVRYLQLKHIGLDIYEVRLLPAEGKIQCGGFSEEINCNRLVTSFY